MIDLAVLDYRGDDEPPIAIRETWLERIRPVEPELKEIMNDADFMIPLTVGNLADDDARGALVPLGLKWPEADS